MKTWTPEVQIQERNPEVRSSEQVEGNGQWLAIVLEES